jgi:hypothetical protein
MLYLDSHQQKVNLANDDIFEVVPGIQTLKPFME